jgi:sporulation protein YlmC with PRC-barrel domain
MLSTQVTGRSVVSTSTADTVGQVADLVIDPGSRSVAAVTLKKTASGDTVMWNDITGFGADAVTVEGAGVIREANDAVKALSSKDHRLHGKRVLTDSGEDLGRLSDVDFDPDSGALNTLIVPNGVVAGSRLISVGSYAIVVHDV